MFEFTDLDFESLEHVRKKLAELAADNKIEGVSLNLSLIDCNNPLIALVVKEILANTSIKTILFRALMLKNIQLLTDQLYAASHLAIIIVSVADAASRIVFFTKTLSLTNVKVIEEKYENNTQEDSDPVAEKCVLITPQFTNPIRPSFLDQNFIDELDAKDEPTQTLKPKKKVCFGDEKPGGNISKIKLVRNTHSAIYKNFELVNEAANTGNEKYLTATYHEFGDVKFCEMLSLPSEISLFEGYRTLHFVVEGRCFKLIKLLHKFGANFLVTITNSKNDTDGFIPFQLAAYKTDINMMLAFSAIDARVVKTMLHYVCTAGKYRGYQALHIALAKLTDQENIGDAPLAVKENAVDMLIQWGADVNFKIDNPDNPWHGKDATEILQDIEQLSTEDIQPRRGLTP